MDTPLKQDGEISDSWLRSTDLGPNRLILLITRAITDQIGF